ncbi:DUF2971 domain-containing protein [Pseudomonas sp. CFBP 8770]|uniref:DUF2971 domain-containing protein n=1 Tax=unclassified Pseudomonas TaxID=196821 RepID=UPI001785EC3F|nr:MULTISPECIES: DUF2971 domain-containing protein [unclassified Pseudomonas]MBD8476457.1 DUF2971 domain-containing protein [Pseudomonas sp. CFBP 8773]MBD8649239.1 DUF2971 domain-containing protein [Pseudomonas sp. CFBP 8770]
MIIDLPEEVDLLHRYKYLPFTEGSLKMITEGTLKFTCPLEFNDPFDCMPAYSPESINEVHVTRPGLIRAVANFHDVTFEEAHAIAIENARRDVESGKFLRGLISGLGVVSLSRTATNVLMWSHYAEHHKGFVVELEISMDAPLQLLEQTMPFPVVYNASRPVLDWANGFDLDRYFLTKSQDWEYEQEERILTTNQGPGIHPYSRTHFLKSVIAGGRMPAEYFKLLKAAVEEASQQIGKDIPLYKAELARDKYKVYVPRHPSPDVREP